jgi:hypothetical protein
VPKSAATGTSTPSRLLERLHLIRQQKPWSRPRQPLVCVGVCSCTNVLDLRALVRVLNTTGTEAISAPAARALAYGEPKYEVLHTLSPDRNIFGQTTISNRQSPETHPTHSAFPPSWPFFLPLPASFTRRLSPCNAGKASLDFSSFSVCSSTLGNSRLNSLFLFPFYRQQRKTPPAKRTTWWRRAYLDPVTFGIIWVPVFDIRARFCQPDNQ